MNKSFLGRGLKFPLSVDSAGGLATSAHEENIYSEEALRKWEPRVKEIKCVCSSDPDQESTLRLEIRYIVRATNSHYNLVYPFFLRREDEA